ncbi:MAG: hypothetical protein OEV06_12105, partial [Anaerolineae bacterium]|nr:hypothetical protein [Anaerolineae bacterium]
MAALGVGMTGRFLLDWAMLAVSLANTILLLWLGFTVTLNAQRRTWGAWVASGGLLVAGLFFASHTAVLSLGADIALARLDLWWNAAWVSVILLPFSWYLVILWYTGFWEFRQASLFRRQRFPFALVSVLGFALLISLFLPQAYPLLFLGYPLYIIANISLALDALRRPGPTGRVMGDIARRRARPWLVATSIGLLVVGLLVAWVMLWLAQYLPPIFPSADQLVILSLYDLLIAVVISAAVLALGQAIVAYEIFTGKALPRRGFLRQWRRVIMLAAGYGLALGFTWVAGLNPIYSLLLTTFLMTVFFSLLSWRSYTERERYIDNLRPFIASQGLLDQLLTRQTVPSPLHELDASFDALCRSVLGVKRAYLVATGPLAPLVGSPLIYPSREKPELAPLAPVSSQFDSPEPKCIPVDAGQYGGASWAVGLWNERGMVGLLLLGEKYDGGLFTQEEIE